MQKALRVTCESWFRSCVLERLGPADYLTSVQEVLIGLAEAMAAHRGLGPAGDFAVPDGLLAELEPRALGDLYQSALAQWPSENGWNANPGYRRRAGAYYTPPGYVDGLLDFALNGKRQTVCDLACGSGAFLVAAARRISRSTDLHIAQIAEKCIYGCDNDPIALDLCRETFWLETGCRLPEHNLQLADSLLGDWRELFPDIEAFDAVVSNPPFGGVVDGRISKELSAARPSLYPELTGTADLSYYFAAKARRLVRQGGRVALVMPRAFLSARSASRIRYPSDRTFRLLESCSAHSAFDGATVHVCLVGYDSPDPVDANQCQGYEPVASLDVRASMTVAEAYKVAKFVKDGSRRRGFKLLTTGLIEPGSNLWGTTTCRFLKVDYLYPRVPQRFLPFARQQQASRPKLIVAGLSKRIESYVDASAECVGSVGTYTVLHPEDDVETLNRLQRYLHSSDVQNRFRGELGPSALSGGNITLTKPFLKQLVADSGIS